MSTPEIGIDDLEYEFNDSIISLASKKSFSNLDRLLHQTKLDILFRVLQMLMLLLMYFHHYTILE